MEKRPSECPTKREILACCSLLSGLGESESAQVEDVARLAHIDKGEVIWMTGGTVDFFGVVGTGFVKMTTTGPGYREITTEIMGPGQVFGLLGTLCGGGCPQCAIAVTDSWILKVRKAEFLPLYEQSGALKEKIFQRTVNRLHHSFELIAHLSVGTVEQRVAAVLLALSRSFGQDVGDGILIDVPLTRQDISECAGTTVESTIRVISKWQKQGWVETQDKHLFFRDMDAWVDKIRA